MYFDASMYASGCPTATVSSISRRERKMEKQQGKDIRDSDIYGIIYDWKGLKEENSLYTVKQLKLLDESYVPQERYDGAFWGNKTYMAFRLTGRTPEETDENIRAFLTGRYNESADMPYIEGWYWETVGENLFTGEKNETTLEHIRRLQIPENELRMKEETGAIEEIKLLPG